MKKIVSADLEDWISPDQKPSIKKIVFIEYDGEFISGYYDKDDEWYLDDGRKLDKELITGWKYL